MLLDPAPNAVGTLLLAVIFAISGAAKMRALDAFVGVVANYRLLPDFLLRPVGMLLPPLELVVALGLLVPATHAWAAGSAAILLVVFAVAMAVNLGRGRVAIDCGCAIGLMKERISWALVGRNAVLVAVAATLALTSSSGRSLAWLDWFTIAAATGCALLLYAATGRLFGVAPARLEGAT
jgi:hypothetical protein